VRSSEEFLARLHPFLRREWCFTARFFLEVVLDLPEDAFFEASDYFYRESALRPCGTRCFGRMAISFTPAPFRQDRSLSRHVRSLFAYPEEKEPSGFSRLLEAPSLRSSHRLELGTQLPSPFSSLLPIDTLLPRPPASPSISACHAGRCRSPPAGVEISLRTALVYGGASPLVLFSPVICPPLRSAPFPFMNFFVVATLLTQCFVILPRSAIFLLYPT